MGVVRRAGVGVAVVVAAVPALRQPPQGVVGMGAPRQYPGIGAARDVRLRLVLGEAVQRVVGEVRIEVVRLRAAAGPGLALVDLRDVAVRGAAYREDLQPLFGYL